MPNSGRQRIGDGAGMSAGSPWRRHARATFGLPKVDRESMRAIARVELPQFARMVIVASAGWQICVWLGAVNPPLYAALVPLVSLKSDPFSAFNLSWSRLIGVLIGLLIGLAVQQVIDPDLLALAPTLSLTLPIGMVVRIGNTPNMQIAISALLVFINPDAGAYGLTRLWETGIGTLVTIVLTPFLFPADPLKAARQELARISDTIGAALRESTRIAGARDLTRAELMRQMVAVTEQLDDAQDRIRTLETQIGSAAKSAPWSVLRRGALRQVGRLGPTRELAARTATNIQSFADEAVAFAERAEFAQDAQLRRAALTQLAEPLGQALDAALAGRPVDEAIQRARAAQEAYVASEHTRVASVTRRPLTRVLEDLEHFGGGPRT